MKKILRVMGDIYFGQSGMAGLRGGGGAAEGTTGMGLGSVKVVVMGVVLMLVGIVMLGVVIDTLGPMVEVGTTIPWDDYPGTEPLIRLFPLLMTISTIILGALFAWMGATGGKGFSMKSMLAITIVTVLGVIFLPTLMDFIGTTLGDPYTAEFTGLGQFLSLIPLLYTVGLMSISGVLGYRQIQSMRKGRGRKAVQTA
jgi:hypothetical protein